MANNDQSITVGQAEITTNYDDGQCSICLGPHVNKSQPDCGHVFCYQCLFDWCKIKLECPSCKTLFSSFYHSMHSPEGWQVCIPERSVVSTDDSSGHFVVVNTPIVVDDAPEDPEFLRAFDEMLNRHDFQRYNTTVIRPHEQGDDRIQGAFGAILGVLNFANRSSLL